MTGLLAHGVGLALVLGHALVNVLDDIGTDGCGEDGGDGVGGLGGLAIGTQDRDGRTGGHCECALLFPRVVRLVLLPKTRRIVGCQTRKVWSLKERKRSRSGRRIDRLTWVIVDGG